MYKESIWEKMFLAIASPVLWLLAGTATVLLKIGEKVEKIKRGFITTGIFILFSLFLAPSAYAATVDLPLTQWNTTSYHTPSTTYADPNPWFISNWWSGHDTSPEVFTGFFKLDLTNLPAFSSITNIVVHTKAISGTGTLFFKGCHTTYNHDTLTYNTSPSCSNGYDGATPDANGNIEITLTGTGFSTSFSTCPDYNCFPYNSFMFYDLFGELNMTLDPSDTHFTITYTAPSPTPTPTPTPMQAPPEATGSSQLTIPKKVWSIVCGGDYSNCADLVGVPMIDDCYWGGTTEPSWTTYQCFIAPDLEAFKGKELYIDKITVSFVSMYDDFDTHITIANEPWSISSYSGYLKDSPDFTSLFAINGDIWDPIENDHTIASISGALQSGANLNGNPNILEINNAYWHRLIEHDRIIGIKRGGLYGYPESFTNYATSIPLITVYYHGAYIPYTPEGDEVGVSPSFQCPIDNNTFKWLCRPIEWFYGLIKIDLTMPTERYNQLRDNAAGRIPFAYMFALEDLTWGDLATSSAIPDFNFNYSADYISNGTSSTVYNQNIHIAGSTFAPIQGFLTQIRTIIEVLLWIAFVAGLIKIWRHLF